MKEMVLVAPGFVELSMDEVFSIDGGTDWDDVWTGVATVAALAAGALLTVSNPAGWVVVATYVCLGVAAFSTGVSIGYEIWGDDQP